MANSEKLIRLLKIISLIERRQGASLSTLIEECEVSERTIYRDIEALATGGMTVYFDNDAKKYRFQENVFLKPLTFSVEEAKALMQCVNGFSQSKTPMSATLRLAQEKIMAALPSEGQKLVGRAQDTVDIRITRPGHDVCKDTFGLVEAAINEQKRIWVEYYTKTRDVITERKLDPYLISFRDKAWYLVAFCHLRGAISIFRIDRIRQSRMLNEKFEFPAYFSSVAFFENSWLLEQGEPMLVRLKFVPDMARWIKGTTYHAGERMKDLEDGSLLYEVTVNGTREITRWILSYGSSVEVLEPENLRREVAADCVAMARVYEDK